VIRQTVPRQLSVVASAHTAQLEGPPQAAPSAAVLTAQLAAELSHDMRVPLSSIIAGLEMLEDELGEHPDPAVASLLASTTEAADRMLRMLEQHMAIDPATGGRSLCDVDLRSVAHQLAVDSARSLALADATLEIGWLPLVRADPDEMYSILQNLLTNAVKFRRPGVNPRVSISASRVAAGWRVSVSDNGTGIPAERREDVFTLFTRLDSQIEGHGIGLGSVARAVRALGGTVGADEAAGGGAEVWFELRAGPRVRARPTHQ
jgi:signal transduction histidine kinase